MVDRTAWSQPSLLDIGRPVRLRFDVLVDPEDMTAVIAYEARQFPDQRLIALASTPPVPFDTVDIRIREMAREFTELVREHTGPFPR